MSTDPDAEFPAFRGWMCEGFRAGWHVTTDDGWFCCECGMDPPVPAGATIYVFPEWGALLCHKHAQTRSACGKTPLLQ